MLVYVLYYISVRPWKVLRCFYLKKETAFCFSLLKCVLFGSCLFSIHELFSNQSISVLVVYCQYVSVYLGFLQTMPYGTVVKKKKKKRNGKQKGTSETKVYHIWETPLNFISLPQISLSLHAKASQYLKRGTPHSMW